MSKKTDKFNLGSFFKSKLRFIQSLDFKNLFQHKIVLILKISTFCILVAILPFLIFTLIAFGGNNATITENQTKVALILGAGVNKNGEPSWILKSRLEAGLKLYKLGKVKILLVSGDNRFDHYNEPKAMKEYLQNQGVRSEDVVEDFAGRRTLDSCWRAKNVFKISDLYIVTQAFHMPRSQFLCQSVGLNTIAAVAPDGIPATTINGVLREVPASNLAIFESFYDKTAQVKGDGSEKDLSQI